MVERKLPHRVQSFIRFGLRYTHWGCVLKISIWFGTQAEMGVGRVEGVFGVSISRKKILTKLIISILLQSFAIHAVGVVATLFLSPKYLN